MKRKILCYTLIACLIICVSIPQKAYAADWAAGIAGAGAAVGGTGGTVLILAGLLLGVAITGDYVSNHQDDINAAINTAVNTAAKGVDNAAAKAQEFWDRVSTGVVDTTSFVWDAVCDVVADIRETIASASSDTPIYNCYNVPTGQPIHLYGDTYATVTSNVGNRVYLYTYRDQFRPYTCVSFNIIGSIDVAPFPWISVYIGTLGDGPLGLGSYNSYSGSTITYVNGISGVHYLHEFVDHDNSLDIDSAIPYGSDSFCDALNAGITDIPELPGQTYGNLDNVIDAYPDAGVGVIGRDGVISIPDVTTVLGVQTLEDAVAAVIADALDYPMVIEAADAIPYVYPLDGIPLAIDPAAEDVDLAVTDVEVSLPSGGTDLDTDMRVYGLEDIFPFCIPFDLYKLFAVLAAEPEAPNFTWEFNVLGNVYTLNIDLSPFDSVAVIMRNMQILLFCIGLALKTRDLIRG